MPNGPVRQTTRALLLAFALAGCLAGCGAGQNEALTTEPTEEVEEEAVPELRPPLEPPIVAEGATPVEVACAEDAAERCNALDDDCDGAIDEGCGYQTGPIQVSVAWNSDADLDVYVVDPGEETVSFQRREGASGARVDHVARGACAEQEDGQEGRDTGRVENVYWSERPPPGEYRVELHYLFECDTEAGPTTATVSVAVAGEVIGAYNLTLTPTERSTVVRFTLP